MTPVMAAGQPSTTTATIAHFGLRRALHVAEMVRTCVLAWVVGLARGLKRNQSTPSFTQFVLTVLVKSSENEVST